MKAKEMLEVYKDFSKKSGYKHPMIPTIYNEEQILGDILSNLKGQAGRAGYKKGFDDGYTWQPPKEEL